MIMKLSTLVLIVVFCVIGIIAIQGDSEKVEEMVNKNFDLAYSNISETINSSMQENLINSTSYEGILIGIVYKLVDVGTYIYFNLAKFASKLAIDNPWINFRLILYLIMAALILMILLPLIKLIAIIYVLIYDIVKNIKHKRELQRLKIEKDVDNVIDRIMEGYDYEEEDK